MGESLAQALEATVEHYSAKKRTRHNAHLFISLLAYHLVHTLRHQLNEKGINLSWESVRKAIATQQRVTLALPTESSKNF